MEETSHITHDNRMESPYILSKNVKPGQILALGLF